MRPVSIAGWRDDVLDEPARGRELARLPCDDARMADLERRSPSRLSRSQRERRAYQLVLATGGLTVVAVVGIVLAIVGVVSGTIPVLAAILAVVCGLLLRRTLNAR
jgi:hypothetical protein